MKLKTKLVLIGMQSLLLILPSITIVAQTSGSSEVTDVVLCDLLKHPEKYDQKHVRVKGIFRSVFEVSELYCPDCYDENKRVWIEPTKIDDECLKSKQTRRLRKGETFLVVFVGKFHAFQRSYGHLNAYKFQIDVKCVEESKVLSKKEPVLPKDLVNLKSKPACQ